MHRQSKVFDYQSKLLIIGDSAVGKSNIMLRFCNDQFQYDYATTIGRASFFILNNDLILGVDFKTKIIEVEGKQMNLQIWDSSGQEKFQVITKSYYKGAQGIIVTYAIDERNSFNNMIDEHASENVVRIVVGNKCDLKKRDITYEEGKKFAEQSNATFFETSAKENINIQELFQCIGKQMLKNIIEWEFDEQRQSIRSSVRLSLNPATQNNNQKKKCC